MSAMEEELAKARKALAESRKLDEESDATRITRAKLDARDLEMAAQRAGSPSRRQEARLEELQESRSAAVLV